MRLQSLNPLSRMRPRCSAGTHQKQKSRGLHPDVLMYEELEPVHPVLAPRTEPSRSSDPEQMADELCDKQLLGFFGFMADVTRRSFKQVP